MENKFSEYFSYYISKVNHLDLVPALQEQKISFAEFLNSIPTEKLNYAYAPEKWTLKEVVFHIIETEIIMLYRAIRISRGDMTALPGYDENMMISKARITEMNWVDIKNLFIQTRSNSLFYFQNFNQSELKKVGTFSNLKLDVKGIGYLNAGHLMHHYEVIKERYLI